MSKFNIPIKDIGHEIQITGFVMSGNGENYWMSFPDDGPAMGPDLGLRFNLLTPTVEEWEKMLYQSDVLETELQWPKKAIVRKSQRVIDQSISWSVYRRDGYACRYCGKNDVPLTVDHIVTYEQGGPTVAANLNSACRRCNRTRGRMSYVDWMASKDYAEISAGLTEAQRAANADIVRQIPLLEEMRVATQRSR